MDRTGGSYYVTVRAGGKWDAMWEPLPVTNQDVIPPCSGALCNNPGSSPPDRLAGNEAGGHGLSRSHSSNSSASANTRRPREIPSRTGAAAREAPRLVGKPETRRQARFHLQASPMSAPARADTCPRLRRCARDQLPAGDRDGLQHREEGRHRRRQGQLSLSVLPDQRADVLGRWLQLHRERRQRRARCEGCLHERARRQGHLQHCGLV